MSRSSGFHLDFERPIVELEKKIEELDSQSEIDGLDLQQEVERFRARAEKLREEIYSNLNAWQRVQISRHPDRPYALDYVERMLSDFTELHGDRLFGDDGARAVDDADAQIQNPAVAQLHRPVRRRSVDANRLAP